MKQMYLIRGGLRNRFHYCNDSLCLALMKDAARSGVSLDYIEEIANNSRNWSQWKATMEAVIADCEEQVEANQKWRQQILSDLSTYRKNVSDDVLINLVARASMVGIPEQHLISNARCAWQPFKEYYEAEIAWRERLIEPLRSALGGYLPDALELTDISEAIRLGMTDQELLGLARQYGDWPRLKASVSNFVDAYYEAESERTSSEVEEAPAT